MDNDDQSVNSKMTTTTDEPKLTCTQWIAAIKEEMTMNALHIYIAVIWKQIFAMLSSDSHRLDDS